MDGGARDAIVQIGTVAHVGQAVTVVRQQGRENPRW